MDSFGDVESEKRNATSACRPTSVPCLQAGQAGLHCGCSAGPFADPQHAVVIDDLRALGRFSAFLPS